MSNPFLSKFNTPLNTIPFDKIKVEHYLPAFEEGIKQGLAEIDAIVNNPAAPDFSNTIEALEKVGPLLEVVSMTFSNLNLAETSKEMQALAKEVSPKLSDYSNDIILNDALFKRVEAVYNLKHTLTLTPEQSTLLDKTFKGFVRNGSKLNDAQKETLRTIDKEKSQLALTYSENVLAESNAYELVITNASDLSGLPEGIVEAAKITAKEKGKDNAWVFTLDYPSYGPFMMYSDNRALKEQLFKAYGSKAFKNNEYDNQAVLKQIAVLRHQRAVLLGYKSHADFVLEERMAESPAKVFSFLENLLDNALPFAKEELEELKAYVVSNNGPEDLKRWDIPYYAERLKKEKFAIDDELLRPYFKLENVIAGVFETAKRLYGLTFTQRNDIPLYHKDVTTYEVKNERGEFLAVFYADFFPRAGKRQGAWMTSFVNQKIEHGVNIRPHVSIVCNFTKPTESKPSLLTFDEVTTLFHEFGHALHGMCANGQYGSMSGTSVYWDFVELPSQILENWCYEKECLDLFAKHYQTGEAIPSEYIQKIIDSSNFQSGLATIRQIGLATLDMAWHSKDPKDIASVKDFELNVTAKTDLMPPVSETSTSCSFSHIFPGGYSAGYYSYKWAEVIDADAFEAFQEKGIFNKEVANAFYKNILSAGGSEHPSILYRRFRGRDADPKALLRRSGLIKEVVK
ncbi:MAG: M3 family metallopeptidase [Bacteroidetes bacterium]|nr:M3 family metallopeptidase [Bacteroidota bacterium]